MKSALRSAVLVGSLSVAFFFAGRETAVRAGPIPQPVATVTPLQLPIVNVLPQHCSIGEIVALHAPPNLTEIHVCVRKITPQGAPPAYWRQL